MIDLKIKISLAFRPKQINNQMTISVFFDGASKLNPGQAGCGWVIKGEKGEKEEKEGYLYCGDSKTNNEAEYTALLNALIDLETYLIMTTETDKNILVMGDSNLVIQQVKGLWKINAENLKPIYNEIQKKKENFKKEGYKIEFMYIPREQNKHADRLSNDAIKAHNASIVTK